MAVTAPTGHKKTVATIILKSNDKLLLLRRLKAPHQGLLCPVGGKLEPFEEPRAAALRETLEETGLEVKKLNFCGTLVETSPLPHYNWLSFIYLAEVPYCEVPFCNEGELEWVAIQELEQADLPKGDIWIYRFALRKQPFMISSVYNADMELLSMREEFSDKNLANAQSS